MKRLELCENHKQEWKQSHYAEHNCDYCKALGRINDLTSHLNRLITEYCDREDPDDLPKEPSEQSCPVIAEAMRYLS